MSIKLPLGAITVNWYCPAEDNCADEGMHPQPLADIMTVGGLICPDCGEDMVMDDVTVTGENAEYPERIIDDVTVPHALAPAYGNVVLMVEAHAVSFGTRYACFKPVGAEFHTPLIELTRETPAVVVRR